MTESLTPAVELAAASAWPFPNDSAEYRRARVALLAEEIELRRHIARVAALRRALPPGGEVTGDYRFIGVDGPMTLADLFADKDTLVVYNAMYGPERTEPCPMCTNLIGGIEGNATDIRQRTAYAVVARAGIDTLMGYAVSRGWRHTPFFQDATGAFTEDYHGRMVKDGGAFDIPALNIFVKEGDFIRHFWGGEMGEAATDPGQDARGAPDIAPLWNILDLTPEGRGADWYPKLRY